jgi:uncharacterized protein (TIGR03089 family)
VAAYPEPVSTEAGRAGVPADVAGLLRAIVVTDPTRPRLTWYGADGERVELSGKVLDNWVAKAANLLVEEVDAGPDRRIAIDLPTGWRAAVWLLATWSTGACAVLPGNRDVAGDPADEATGDLDAWVSDRPGSPAAAAAADAGALLIAVALPALAASFGPGLPPGALDAAVEGRGRGDVFLPLVPPLPTDPALQRPGRPALSHGELAPAAAAAAGDLGLASGVRLLTDAGPAQVEPLLAAWWSGGSVVLHHDLGLLDAAQRQRLADEERVTATFSRAVL